MISAGMMLFDRGAAMASTTPTRIDPAPFLTADQDAVTAILPEPLAALAQPIVRSRSMLELSDDWDDAGSPGYRPETWLRAVALLLGSALRLWDETGIAAVPAKVRKGPNGSIDLHWVRPQRELFVNVPVDPGAQGEFYGDDGEAGHVVKGSLDADEEHAWLLMWLMHP